VPSAASSPATALPKANLHDWETLRSELLFIYDQAIPPGSGAQGGQRDGDFSAWLVRRGWASMRADGCHARAEPGHWLICFGRQVEQELAPATHLLSLRILHDWPDGSPLFGGTPLYVLRAARYPQLEKLACPLLRMAGRISFSQSQIDPRGEFLWKRQIDYLTYTNYRRHLMAWLTALARALHAEGARLQVPDRKDARLARCIQLLDAAPSGDPFPESDLGRISGLSIGRLNHLCAQAYGCTAHAYWERRRVQRARRALEAPSTRVKEIASELGFVQLSHFSAWFKRHTGSSPRAFRRNLLG